MYISEQKFDQEFSSSRYKEIWKKKKKNQIKDLKNIYFT